MMGGARDARVLWAFAVCLGAAAVTARVGDLAYFGNGYDIDFYVPVAGDRALVTSVVEHRIEIENRYRPLSRIVQGWPFGSLPIPERTPVLDATIRARLAVPAGRPRRLVVRTDGAVAVRVDGRISPPDLAPGSHALEIDWRGSFSDDTHLELLWEQSDDSLDPVPRAALVPSTGAWPRSRAAWWIGCLVIGLLAGALVGRVASARGAAARAARARQLATCAVVLVAVLLRAFDYDVMPEYRENADETFAMWNGWSLLEDGTPRGWTPWRHVYEGRGTGHVDDVWAFGVDYRVATPYFDHPPLMHIIVGAACHLAGTDQYLGTRLRDGRVVAIAMSIISLLLTIALARRVAPTGPAPWIAGLLFATLPFLVLQHRVVKEEWLLTILGLGALEAFFRWRDDGRARGWLIVAAVAVGLAPMTKVPGAAFIPALGALVASTERPRSLPLVLVIAMPLAATLLLYGAVIDWEVFRAAVAQQSIRAIHWNIFLRWFDDALVNHNLLGRGWLLFVWLATMAALFGARGRSPVASAMGVFFVFYWAAISLGSGNWTYGWYSLPWMPLLCIGAAVFLADVWERPTLLGGAFFVVVFVFYGFNFLVDPAWAQQADAWPILRSRVTYAMAATLGPLALIEFRRNGVTTTLARAVLLAGFAAYLGVATYVVARYEVLYDTHRNFDRMVFFDR